MSDMFDFSKMINDSTDLQQRMIKLGREVERDRLIPHLQAIFNAYRSALADQKTMLPTPLHLAIANAQREVGEIRGLQPARNFIDEARDDLSITARKAGL